MRIYLIGYSYSGKTTMGRQLAEKLGYRYFDTDKAIELRYHTTIPLFFSRYGEKAFRIIESETLRDTADLDDVVVATGGGLACNDENIRFILEHGTAIYLEMSVDDIMNRIAHARKGRPSMKGMDMEEKRRFVTRQLEERVPFYSRAQLKIAAYNTSAEALEQLLKNSNI
ncbi:MAG: shikimate kinase [Bacteroidales bacterium]|nr:shikimate kinase [Bacteroidales bacterium]